MFFFQQFEVFDPVSGHIPSTPFSYMPEIASRARRLLNCSRVSARGDEVRERILAIARRISDEIDWYFADALDTEILRLKSELSPEDDQFHAFFEPDDLSDRITHWCFKTGMEDELDIPTANNTSEVDALQAVIEKRDSNFFFSERAPVAEPNEYPEGKDYELFATLALWLLVDAVSFCNDAKAGLSIAGEYALKAMEAVCYAEHLHEAEWLVSYARKQGDAKLTEALQEQQAEHRAWVKRCNDERQERERLEKAANMKQLGRARHKKTHDAKAMALDEWLKEKTKFPSAEKAGNYLADWLGSQGVVNSTTNRPFEPRTVIGWIRAHAKQIGVRFR